MPLNWPLGLQFFHPRVQLLSCSLRELSQMHSFLCYRKAPCFLYGVTGLQPFDRPLVTAQSSGCSARGCTPGFVTCSHPTAAASPPPAWPQPRPLHSSESKLTAVLAAPRVFLPLCLLRRPWVCIALSPWLPGEFLSIFPKFPLRIHHTTSVLS